MYIKLSQNFLQDVAKFGYNNKTAKLTELSSTRWLITFSAEIIVKFPSAFNSSVNYGDEPGRGRTSPAWRRRVPCPSRTGPGRDQAGCRDRAAAGTRRRLPFGARFVSSDRTQPPDRPLAQLSRDAADWN